MNKWAAVQVKLLGAKWLGFHHTKKKKKVEDI